MSNKGLVHHFDDTIYCDLLRTRASAFSTFTLLSARSNASAENSVILINCELIIENITIAIKRLELNQAEKEQEEAEINFLKKAGFLKDARFA